MIKLLKFLFGLLLVVVLLVVAAAIIIPLVVDPNDFKEEIVDQVKQTTGRDLTIDGNIGLSVFPWLGVELDRLALSQPQGFGEEPFAAVERAQVRAKLMPLLEQRLVVDQVELQGLQLNLIRDPKGVGNWEDLAAGTSEKGAAAPGEERREEDQGPHSLFIGGVSVTDSQVSWDDRQTGQKVVIRELGLETGTLVPGQPLDLKLGFAVDNEAPKVSGRIQLAGTLTLSDDQKKLTAKPFELRLQEFKTEDGVLADGALNATLVMDLEGQKLQIDNLSVAEELRGGPLGGLLLNTRLDARVQADLAAGQYRVEGLKLTSNIKGEQIPGGALDTVLTATVSADLAKELMEIQNLNLKAADLHVSGRLQGNQLQSDPHFTGKLSLAPVDLRTLLPKLGLEAPQTADPKVLKSFALDTDINATAKQATLNNLVVYLDDSALTGKLLVQLQPQGPGFHFTLKLDSIDLDRYLPPPAEQQAATETAQAPTSPVPAEQPLFPVEQLRQLDIDGSFEVSRLTVNKLKLNDARITLKAKDGDIRIDQQVGSFYQGSLGGNLGLDVKGSTPRLKVVQRVKNIQAEPLVKDLAGQDRLSGTGNVNLDVSGSGQTVQAIKRSLDGKLNFAFTDGAVKGINLGRMLRETAAKLEGKSLPPESGPNQTDFSELEGSGVIHQGVLHNDDLSAKSPLFRVTGKGQIDIGRDTLDYKIKPVLVASLEGQGGEELDKLEGIPIPIHLTGPLAKPDWSIDLAEALTESQKAKAKEKLQEKIQEKLPENIKQKFPGLDKQLDGALKGLFN